MIDDSSRQALDVTHALARHAGIYVWYYAGACARYFAVAGGIYLTFYVWLRPRLARFRIQAAYPRRADVGHEIRWSLASLACSGVASVLLYDMVQAGWTSMYFDVGRHGWPYLVATVVLGVVGYDAWFYWQHRLLHTEWWFRRAHQVHHRVTNPTPFANFTHHPIEITLGNVYFVLLVTFVPLHPIALALVSMAIFGWGMLAHLGYELYPKRFGRHAAFGWINSATHHNLHHSEVGCNYGLLFNFWDRVMATNHPEYRARFAAIGGEPEVDTEATQRLAASA